MTKRIIDSEDSIEDVLEKMSNGNPGALNVLNRIIDKKEEQGFKLILKMDSLGLRGSSIWICYKDYCKKDIDKFISEIKSPDSGMMNFVE